MSWRNEVPETVMNKNTRERVCSPYLEDRNGYWWCVACSKWLQAEPHLTNNNHVRWAQNWCFGEGRNPPHADWVMWNTREPVKAYWDTSPASDQLPAAPAGQRFRGAAAAAAQQQQDGAGQQQQQDGAGQQQQQNGAGLNINGIMPPPGLLSSNNVDELDNKMELILNTLKAGLQAQEDKINIVEFSILQLIRANADQQAQLAHAHELKINTIENDMVQLISQQAQMILKIDSIEAELLNTMAHRGKLRGGSNMTMSHSASSLTPSQKSPMSAEETASPNGRK